MQRYIAGTLLFVLAALSIVVGHAALISHSAVPATGSACGQTREHVELCAISVRTGVAVVDEVLGDTPDDEPSFSIGCLPGWGAPPTVAHSYAEEAGQQPQLYRRLIVTLLGASRGPPA